MIRQLSYTGRHSCGYAFAKKESGDNVLRAIKISFIDRIDRADEATRGYETWALSSFFFEPITACAPHLALTVHYRVCSGAPPYVQGSK